MTDLHLHKKFHGLIPPDEWKNPKGHLSALTKGGKVIAYGESNLGGVPRFCTNRGSSCHSEMQVLKCIECEDKRKVRKYIMWNIRWTKSGAIANSKPCINCQKALIEFGLQTIVYSTQDGRFIKCRLDELICKPSSGFLNSSKY